MILYHGSYIEVAKPDVTHSRKMWISVRGSIQRRYGNRQRNGVKGFRIKDRMRLFPYISFQKRAWRTTR